MCCHQTSQSAFAWLHLQLAAQLSITQTALHWVWQIYLRAGIHFCHLCSEKCYWPNSFVINISDLKAIILSNIPLKYCMLLTQLSLPPMQTQVGNNAAVGVFTVQCVCLRWWDMIDLDGLEILSVGKKKIWGKCCWMARKLLGLQPEWVIFRDMWRDLIRDKYLTLAEHGKKGV